MAYKVIVADNSPSVQRAAKMALSDSEFEIYAFADGQEVLKHLSQIEPDVVLLRLSLPPENGYEVGGRIKADEKFKGTPLILLKGVFEEINEKKMAELEYDKLVELPFDADKLVRLVQELIERRNDPRTLPEEIEMDEISSPEIQTGPDEKIKFLVRKEIHDAERKLAERIRNRLLPEIKSWLLQKLEDMEKKKTRMEDAE